MCIGHAESMAAVLLASGEVGHRAVQPHARVMIHQPSLGVSRSTSIDVIIQAKEGLKTNERLVALLAQHTGKSTVDVAKALDRNFYMDASAAKEFGLVDMVGGSIVEDHMKKTSTSVDAPMTSGKLEKVKEVASSSTFTKLQK